MQTLLERWEACQGILSLGEEQVLVYVHNISKHKAYKYLFYLQMPLHNISNSVFLESTITCGTCEPRQLPKELVPG